VKKKPTAQNQQTSKGTNDAREGDKQGGERKEHGSAGDVCVGEEGFYRKIAFALFTFGKLAKSTHGSRKEEEKKSGVKRIHP